MGFFLRLSIFLPLFLIVRAEEGSLESFTLKDPPVRDVEYCQIKPNYVRYIVDAMINEISDKDQLRYLGFKEALKLIISHDSQVIVETGTARSGDQDCPGDGCSTLILGYFAYINNSTLYSIDKDLNHVKASQIATSAYSSNINIIHSDSVKFLTSFNNSIDFLYLDSQEFSASQESANKRYLQEISAAFNKLHKRSIVMIDDCGFYPPGNCESVRNFLLLKGWTVFYSDYQMIFINY